MGYPIQNITDLQDEIFRLKSAEYQQKVALKARFNGFPATFSSILSLFHHSSGAESTKNQGLGANLLGVISKFILPMTLNRTLFKKSNFLVKMMVGLASQKASKFINEDAVSGVWGKITSLFNKATKSKPVIIRKSMPAIPPPVIM